MSMNLPEVPEDFKGKSFWEKPEGTTGMLFLVAGLLVGGWLLYALLPVIITLLTNTLTAAFLFGAVGAVFYVGTSKQFRWLIGNVYKSVMRSITGIFVTVDPIGILKNYVEDLRKKDSEMVNQRRNLAGQVNSLREQIAKNKRDMRSNLQIAEQAKKKGEQDLFLLKARRFGRLNKSNVSFEDLAKKMEMLLRVLDKINNASQFLIADIEDEIEVKEREWKMMKAATSAFRSGMKVLDQNSYDRQMFERAMDYLAEDFGRKVGEIDGFLAMSNGFIKSVDIQNGVFEEEALNAIMEWEKKTDSLLLSEADKQLLLDGPELTMDELNEGLPSREEVMSRPRGGVVSKFFDG